MKESTYPIEWCPVTLGEIADWGSGGTPSRKQPEYYDGDVPWVKTGDLGPRVLASANEYITELGVKNSSAKFFPKNSVAIAMYGATIGRTSILGFDATTNQACAVGQPVKGVTDSVFLYYLLRNEKDAFIAKGKGGAQPNISQTLIKEHLVALPSIEEQKVIADKLDTLLAQVEATKARLERIPKILKRFRQSVLNSAVSGRLTEDFRSGSQDKWEYPRIRDVGKIQLGRQRSPKFHSGKNMKPYLRVQNVFEDHVDTSDVMFMEFSEDDFERYKLVEGDILLNEGQSPKFLGRPAIYRGELPGACFTNTLIRFRAGGRTFPEYALIVFRNHMHSGRYIEEGTITTNIAHLGLGRFGSVEFPLPSLDEQREVVERVDRLFSFADRIESQASSALKSINNLTQSILAKAFRGELTEQWRKDNPDLISGENSAEAILQRIKAEREQLSALKPKRRRKSK